jgi:peptidoglycan/LPS O-acetylase OafA/YrhL
MSSETFTEALPSRRNQTTAASDASGASGSRIPELDGLRGLASLVVLVAHYFGEVAHGYRGLTLAWAGVDLFFVLSGFLIGGILLDQRGSPNYFSTFYIRRAFRIFPIYYLTITLVLVATAIAARGGRPSWIDATLSPVAYYTYTQNFVLAWLGNDANAWLLPTWTLSVEEQFYLLLPAVLYLAPLRHLKATIVTLILSATAFRLLLAGGSPNSLAIHVLLPCRWDLLFFGVAAAWVRRNRDLWALATANNGSRLKTIVLPSALMVPVIFFCDDRLGLRLFDVVGLFFVGACVAAFLLLIVSGSPEGRRFRSAALRQCGALSYGLYLIHQPIAGILHGVILGSRPDIETLPQILVTLLALASSLALAALSWTCFERPLLRIGHRWTFERATVSPL